jgi:hypothetical protein
MENYVVNLGLTIKQRQDGTFIAMARELPVMVVAADMNSLRRKLSEVAESIAAHLASLGDIEARKYLDERGIAPGRVGTSETDEFSMPVLVGA